MRDTQISLTHSPVRTGGGGACTSGADILRTATAEGVFADDDNDTTAAAAVGTLLAHNAHSHTHTR
jgi:hypothetical protein